MSKERYDFVGGDSSERRTHQKLPWTKPEIKSLHVSATLTGPQYTWATDETDNYAPSS